MNVVILIRHITIIDKNYGEVRSMPEFCYDYDTFVKLGGWIEHTTRVENVVNIARMHKDFNCLYSGLLKNLSAHSRDFSHELAASLSSFFQ